MEHILGFDMGFAVFREDEQDITAKQVEEFNDKLIGLVESMGMEMGGGIHAICSACDEEENPRWRKACPAWKRWGEEPDVS